MDHRLQLQELWHLNGGGGETQTPSGEEQEDQLPIDVVDVANGQEQSQFQASIASCMEQQHESLLEDAKWESKSGPNLSQKRFQHATEFQTIFGRVLGRLGD